MRINVIDLIVAYQSRSAQGRVHFITTVTPLISGLDRTIITKGRFCHSYEAASALTTSFELATVDCRGKIFVFVQSESTTLSPVLKMTGYRPYFQL